MRWPEDALPPPEESKRETEKRLRLVEEIRPEFEKFCEIMIVVGSVAMGKNYSVRKSSDIDILFFVNRESIQKIKDCPYVQMTPKYEEALGYFLKGEVDHFSINTEYLEEVQMQYHFWEKQAHFKTERGEYTPIIYNVWKNPGDEHIIYGIDFNGVVRKVTVPIKRNCQHGVIHEYPDSLVIDGHFLFRQPIINLISDPDIIFCKDKELYENVDVVWNRVAKKFLEEDQEYDKKNPLKFIMGNWSFSKESRNKIEKKFKEALSNQSAKVSKNYKSAEA